jgi:hypothetical protein
MPVVLRRSAVGLYLALAAHSACAQASAPPTRRPPPPVLAVDRAPKRSFVPPACLPPGATAGAKIVALGAYEGGNETALSFDGNSHEVGAIAVAADRQGPPLLLVLSTYDPVVWDLSGVPAQRIRAVLTYGGAQGVTGLPASVPIRSSVVDSASCGKAGATYHGGPELDRLAAAVAMATGGGKIEAFQGAYRPRGFNIDRGPVPQLAAMPLAAKVRAPVAVITDPVPAGRSGLAALVAAGAIRPANAADLTALQEARTRASPTSNLAPVPPLRFLGMNVFMLLRPITIPKGLTGMPPVAFLVPSGIPSPSDPSERAAVYSLADGRCFGLLCAMGR